MSPKRRYGRLQFWMEDIYGDWISLPLSGVAPGDLDIASAAQGRWTRAVIGVGEREQPRKTVVTWTEKVGPNRGRVHYFVAEVLDL